MSTISDTLIFIQKQLNCYMYPFYFLCGFVGCCLNIILLTRRQFRSVSCCIYLNIASVMMLFTLTFGVIINLISIGQPNPHATIAAVCKIRSYVLVWSFMVFRWCLVAASLDRYVATSSNVNLRNLAKPRRACYVTATIVIIWLIIPLHVPIFYDVRFGACAIFDNIGVALYHGLYITITGGILPVSLFLIFAILIRRNLRLRRRLRRNNTNQQNSTRSAEQKRDQQVIVMLFFQVLVYVISQTPWMVFLIYSASTIYVTNKSANRVSIERFIYFVVEIIIYLLPVLSFYVHIVVSRTFRKELVKLFAALLRCHRHPQIHPATIHQNTA